METNQIHNSITIDKVTDAAQRQMFGTDNPGFCISCGEEVDGCDPDTANKECEFCGSNTVFGAMELLMKMA